MRVTEARKSTLSVVFEDLDAARREASKIKGYVLDNLKPLLLEFESKCTSNGIKVHWASDADSARRAILDICSRASDKATVVKAKSMATEEIHLNSCLEEAGHTVLETDLGEFVVQLDRDTPSHIVAPIIHKDRRQIGASLEREGIGPYTEDPEEIIQIARAYMREEFQAAHVGISGVNFAIASTGRLVIVENEGNNRLCTTAPRIHIAVMGIEKLLPSEADLPLFLRLLAGSATGQRVTVYTHFITGPRQQDELDGPDEVHLVLLDNGRSRILNGPQRDILKCIRCGACLNVCPVYRRSSGHAYGHVYPGPLGAVLAPSLEGIDALGDLAKASSLCGACQEVCPVDIPIPDMLLQLRSQDPKNAKWKWFGMGARNAMLWRAGISSVPMFGMPKSWREYREQPQKRIDFRSWWRGR
jgi:L-lactate dehydrogenase complex protein LldF